MLFGLRSRKFGTIEELQIYVLKHISLRDSAAISERLFYNRTSRSEITFYIQTFLYYISIDLFLAKNL